MAYYLINRKGNSTRNERKIELEKLEFFKDLRGTDIKNIDAYTSRFECESDLKKDLFLNKLITEDEVLDNLVVRSERAGQMKTVPYGVLYKSNSNFFDSQKISIFLMNNMNNIDFLRSFCNKYKSSYYTYDINTICAYLRYLESLYGDSRQACLDDKKEMINNTVNAIDSFVRYTVFRTDKKTGESKIQYRNLRELAMFIDKKDKEMYEIINEEEIVREDDEFLTEEDYKRVEIVEEEPVKVKVKTKRVKKQIEGQMTFGDMGWI